MLESSQATCSTVASLVKGNSGRFNVSNMNWCGRGLVVSPGTRAYAVPTRSLREAYAKPTPVPGASWQESGETFLKSLDEGFSTFSMVCACLNPPPCIKGAFFSPPQRSWFPNRIPGKFSHIRRISQGQVLSQSEGSRSRLQK